MSLVKTFFILYILICKAEVGASHEAQAQQGKIQENQEDEKQSAQEPSIESIPFHAGLWMVSEKATLQLITSCLDKNPNAINGRYHVKNNQSLLSVACCKGYPSVAQFLIDRRANVNHRDREGLTPLHCTLHTAHAKSDKPYGALVKTLITAKADLTATTNDGTTPFMYALEMNNYKAVEVFLELGAGSIDEPLSIAKYEPQLPLEIVARLHRVRNNPMASMLLAAGSPYTNVGKLSKNQKVILHNTAEIKKQALEHKIWLEALVQSDVLCKSIGTGTVIAELIQQYCGISVETIKLVLHPLVKKFAPQLIEKILREGVKKEDTEKQAKKQCCVTS